jgi:hypothetical protein
VNYSYHPDARQEASAAVAYYAAIDQQLGADFLAQLENAITRVVSAPEAWTKHMVGTRRCLLHRFPYGVEYQGKRAKQSLLSVTIWFSGKPDKMEQQSAL